MSDLVHSPGGQLAPPREVLEQAEKIRAQGFPIEHIRPGTCQEDPAKGKPGWCITTRNSGRWLHIWVFGEPVADDLPVKSVDVEIC